MRARTDIRSLRGGHLGGDTRTIVVKVGSSSLTQHDGLLDRNAIFRLADLIAEVRSLGARVVLVSSGAVAAGRGVLRQVDLVAAQRSAIAAVGQNHLMSEYVRAFTEVGLACGQILLTDNDFRSSGSYEVLRRSLSSIVLLDELVPVINANDAVAHSIHENDKLAARIAIALDADRLVILTDVDGLYESDPRVDTKASLIEWAESDELLATLTRLRIGGDDVDGAGSAVSSGGIASKITAARLAGTAGIDTVVCGFSTEGVLQKLVDGQPIGTYIRASRPRLDTSQQFVGVIAEERGRVKVNAGAEEALRARGSLVSVGVNAVRGSFSSGDVISVWSKDWSNLLGRGIAEVSSTTLGILRGRNAEWIDAFLSRVTVDEVRALKPVQGVPNTERRTAMENSYASLSPPLSDLGRRGVTQLASMSEDALVRFFHEAQSLLMDANEEKPRLLPIVDRRRFVSL